MHYIYNLRDVSKVFQGVTRSVPLAIKDDVAMIKLWGHECLRVFQDRLINTQDRDFFQSLLRDTIHTFFRKDWDDIVTVSPLLFGSFIPMISREEGKNKVPDLYCELNDRNLLKDKMLEFLELYYLWLL